MAAKWIGTKYKGVRYYEHPTRKHGLKKDHYLAIRYQRDGIRIEEGIGWTSERDPEDNQFWTESKAALALENLRGAAKHGKKEAPTRITEKRKIETERRIAEKEELERNEREAVTFGDFFKDTYLPQAKTDKKEKSVEREEGLFNVWIKPSLSKLPMKDITPFHLEKLKRKMDAGGQSPRSVEYALSVIRQVFNTAKRLRVFNGENPTASVKFPKPDNGRMRFLTQKEADALLNLLKIHSPDVHDITLLSLHCGLRFGEIAALTWQDVDLKKGVLTIRDAKAGSRFAFLTDQAAEMLKAKERGKPSEYIFTGRKGKLKQISLTFAKAVDELKLNDDIDDPRLQIVFHSCRHSYASWLIEQGQDLYTVQKILGHKTNVMTQRYAHLTENKLRDAAKALSQALQPKRAGQVLNFKK